MKKIKILLLIVAVLLVVPFGVFAEEAKTDVEESKEVKLYLFYGEGCGFCQKAKAWLDEIEDEYGDMFEVVKYEVWNDENNQKLMAAVSEARKENPGGVPYIIVGNQSWDGFTEDYEEGILEKIKSEYEQEPSERYDIMNYVSAASPEKEKDTTAQDVLILLVILGVVGAVTAGIVVARKNTN